MLVFYFDGKIYRPILWKDIMLDFSSAAKVWPTKPTKVSANQSVSRGVSACIWWVNAGYIQMMLDCFASSWARFKLSCLLFFFCFFAGARCNKSNDLTANEGAALFSYTELVSVWTQPYSCDNIVMSHKKLCQKKKRNTAKKQKHSLWSIYYSVIIHQPEPPNFYFLFFLFFPNISTHCPQCWERESLWADVNIFVNFWIKWINWMCERACVCVCMIYIYSIYEYIILWSVEPWMNRRMWQGVGRW